MTQLSEESPDHLIAPGELVTGAVGRTNFTGSYRVQLSHRTFPGALAVYLEVAEARQLASLLRTKTAGNAGPVVVQLTRFATYPQPIITLHYHFQAPGKFFVYIGDDEAQRVADQLDAGIEDAAKQEEVRRQGIQ